VKGIRIVSFCHGLRVRESRPNFESYGIWQVRRFCVRGGDAAIVNHPVRYGDNMPALCRLSPESKRDTGQALRTTAYTGPECADLAAERVIAMRGREPRFGTFPKASV
jgi:hypothetical protein